MNTNPKTTSTKAKLAAKYNEEVKTMNTNPKTTNTPNTGKAIMIADNRPTFKNAALNAETQVIFDSVNAYNQTADTTRKAVAIALYHIEKDTLYKDDGHKSLAEYAATIGLDKSLAHKLENAGRLLESANETIRNFAAGTDYSKLAILASADEKDLEEAIKGDELTKESTQAEVKEWKANKANKGTKDTKVLSPYEWDFTIYGKTGMQSIHYDAKLEDDVAEFEGAEWGRIKTKNGAITVGILPDGSMVRIINKAKVVQPKAPKYRPGTKFDPSALSDEMLAAAMAELARRQKAEQEG